MITYCEVGSETQFVLQERHRSFFFRVSESSSEQASLFLFLNAPLFKFHVSVFFLSFFLIFSFFFFFGSTL